MPIPRAKILTRITVPEGGWDLEILYSESAQYDTSIVSTIPAGNYFLAWDQTSDDFLFALANQINVDLDAAGLTGWLARYEGLMFWIDSDHKVHLGFDGNFFDDATHRDVRINWTTYDGYLIAAALGFDSTAALSLTGVDNPTATADWHHGYGWYSDEDGQTEMLFIEPHDMPNTEQTYGPGGHSKSQYIGSRFINRLDLVFIPQIKMWSRNIGYGENSVHPYMINEPLQCWFVEARNGTEFRVYRHNTIDLSIANESGTKTGGGLGYIQDTGKNWEIDPQQLKGSLLYSAQYANKETWPMRWQITSNTSNTIYFNVAEPRRSALGGSPNEYWVFDQPFETYVLDQRKMRGFAPRERGGGLNLFDLSIPLSRHET